jgi:HAD superfamily hydrolase (TIGR01509 family)
MGLIIFDFDGVVADSEWIANQALAEGLTAIGMPTTVEDCLNLYTGKRWGDCEAAIEARHGAKLPAGFVAQRQADIMVRLAADLKPVPGVEAFLDRFAAVPRCIASSSRVDAIAVCLDIIGLAHRFAHRFSGHDIERGKPHPDLFLLAAATMGAQTQDCIVIEDSVTGVTAGKAAGMLTIGLCAGSHIVDGHAERLEAAGADHVVGGYEDVAAIVGPMLAA